MFWLSEISHPDCSPKRASEILKEVQLGLLRGAAAVNHMLLAVVAFGYYGLTKSVVGIVAFSLSTASYIGYIALLFHVQKRVVAINRDGVGRKLVVPRNEEGTTGVSAHLRDPVSYARDGVARTRQIFEDCGGRVTASIKKSTEDTTLPAHPSPQAVRGKRGLWVKTGPEDGGGDWPSYPASSSSTSNRGRETEPGRNRPGPRDPDPSHAHGCDGDGEDEDEDADAYYGAPLRYPPNGGRLRSRQAPPPRTAHGRQAEPAQMSLLEAATTLRPGSVGNSPKLSPRSGGTIPMVRVPVPSPSPSPPPPPQQQQSSPRRRGKGVYEAVAVAAAREGGAGRDDGNSSTTATINESSDHGGGGRRGVKSRFAKPRFPRLSHGHQEAGEHDENGFASLEETFGRMRWVGN